VTTGQLRLRAARCGGRTVLADLYRTVPFHPGPVTYRGDMADVILQDVSPGLFPGDRLEIAVEVEDGAALSVAGQGATRLYPCPPGTAADARISLCVRGAGTLWWLPGFLIPFRDARYAARAEINLDEGAKLAYLEIVTPGRVAMGERFAFRRLDMRLRIVIGGRPRLVERTLLEPRDRPLDLRGSLGDFACAGALVLVGYQAPTRCDAGDVWLGIGGSPALTVVRGLAQAVEPLRAALLGVLRDAAS
jgi:urease accessory protein